MEVPKSSVDELADMFASKPLVVDDEEEWAHRRAKYKEKPMEHQQKRREQALERQKSARLDRTNLARGLASLKPTATQPPPTISNAKPSTPTREEAFEDRQVKKYANQLQLPEPLLEIPPDFIDSWLCVPRPVGHRCLVIATQGKTYARTIDGSLIVSFNSILPGGCPRKATRSDAFCILDCIYSEATLSFYIVDVMCWNSRVFYDCDAAMRQLWAKSRISEDGPFDQATKEHAYRFFLLPQMDCIPEALSDLSQQARLGQLNYSVKSLLFYHKEGNYEHEMTPLMFEMEIERFSEFMAALNKLSEVSMIS